jgi:hypothetical protein
MSLLTNDSGEVHGINIGVSKDGYHVLMVKQSACLQFYIIPTNSSMLLVRMLLAQDW